MLSQTVDQLRLQLQSAESQLEEVKSQLDESRRGNDDLFVQIPPLHQQIGEFRRENDRLQLSLGHALEETQQQASTIMQLQSTVDELRGLNKDSQNTVNSLLQQLEDATTSANTVQAFASLLLIRYSSMP